MTRPLCSRPITGRSTLLRVVPPLCLASVLLASRLSACERPSLISSTASPCTPFRDILRHPRRLAETRNLRSTVQSAVSRNCSQLRLRSSDCPVAEWAIDCRVRAGLYAVKPLQHVQFRRDSKRSAFSAPKREKRSSSSRGETGAEFVKRALNSEILAAKRKS